MHILPTLSLIFGLTQIVCCGSYHTMTNKIWSSGPDIFFLTRLTVEVLHSEYGIKINLVLWAGYFTFTRLNLEVILTERGIKLNLVLRAREVF